MDTRFTPEQAELRRTARRLARELGPRTDGRAQSVMGGTSQIQKNIIAARILGLPAA